MKPFLTAVMLSLSLSFGAGCAHLPLKQQGVVSLQASETALESAHDIERALCFNTPATESGGHCTNVLAATVKLTDANHQTLAALFSHAFDIEIKAATALRAWKAGDPAPSTVATYQADIQAILTLALALDPGAVNFVIKAQAAVDAAAGVATLVGVK